VYINFI